MPGEQLLFHRETNPGSGLADICFDFTNVLDMPGIKKIQKKKDRKKEKTVTGIVKVQ